MNYSYQTKYLANFFHLFRQMEAKRKEGESSKGQTGGLSSRGGRGNYVRPSTQIKTRQSLRYKKKTKMARMYQTRKRVKYDANTHLEMWTD